VKILVSACLMGESCRYDGKSNCIGLQDKYPHLTFVKVCPEVMGGLPVPRSGAEISKNQVITLGGDDVTKEFAKGAQKALEVALKNKCTVAILKAKSPSCGSGQIYDGTFTGTLIAGDGVSATLLKANGIKIFSEKNLEEFEGHLRS